MGGGGGEATGCERVALLPATAAEERQGGEKKVEEREGGGSP